MLKEGEIKMTLLEELLLKHVGHDVHISVYGHGQNICLECWDCESIIFDNEAYDLVGLDENEGEEE